MDNKVFKELSKKHILRVFQIKYDKLLELIESDNFDDSLQISAILRHLLTDHGESLLTGYLESELGLSLSIGVTDDYMSLGAVIFQENYKPLNNATTYYNLNNFLKLVVYEIGGDQITIYDLIDSIANAGGGVHHNGDNDRLIRLAIYFTEFKADTGFYLLKSIALHVIKGLENMRIASEGRFTNFEQRKRKRQPEIIVSATQDSNVYFDGSNYLEAYFEANFSTGGTIILSFIIPEKQNKYPAIIYEGGNRKTNQRFVLLILDKSNKASFRYYENDSNYVEIIFNLIPLHTTIIGISYKYVLGCGIQFNLYKKDKSFEKFEVYLKKPYSNKVVGKSVIASDLKGKNGAILQTDTPLIMFNKYFNEYELKELFSHVQVNEISNAKWIYNNILPQKAYVTTFYNQG